MTLSKTLLSEIFVVVAISLVLVLLYYLDLINEGWLIGLISGLVGGFIAGRTLIARKNK